MICKHCNVRMDGGEDEKGNKVSKCPKCKIVVVRKPTDGTLEVKVGNLIQGQGMKF